MEISLGPRRWEEMEKLSKEIETKWGENALEIFQIFLAMEEPKLVIFQIDKESIQYSEREIEGKLEFLANELKERWHTFKKKDLALSFYHVYLSLGISGLELAGKTDFVDRFEKKLRYIFLGHLEGKIMDEIINTHIASFRDRILSHGISYVPSFEEFSFLIENLWRYIESL